MSTRKEIIERQKIMLEKMKRNPKITVWDLTWILKVSDRTIFEDIKELKEKGFLKRVGPNHRGEARGHWEVLKESHTLNKRYV